jgi:hypothetical protein
LAVISDGGVAWVFTYMTVFLMPEKLAPPQPEPVVPTNLELYGEMAELARLQGITLEQALHDALTAWIRGQKVVRMPCR